MKILAVRGCNLASLAAPFAIDFSAAPLADAGVFVICGPTGAGKSTLLDALCLALYHRTPRMEGGSATVLDLDGDALGARDPRQWLRRGASSGYAEVDLLGVDGVVWRARWTVRRARERSDGRLQQAEASLIAPATGEQRGRTLSEVREAIVTVVGLDYAQFTRAVLLAQNQFARFLQAEPAERAMLLEALTGAQLYSSLSRAAHARARQSLDTVRQLEQQLAAHILLSPAARATLEAELAASQTDEQTALLRMAPLQDALRWLRDVETAEAAEHAAAQACVLAESGYDALDTLRSTLALCQLAAQLRPLLEAEEESQRVLQTATAALSEAQAALGPLEAASHHSAAQLEQATQAVEAAQAQMQAAEPLLRQARELDLALALAQQHATQAEHLLQTATEAMAQAETQLREQQVSVQQLQQAQTTLTAALHAHAADAPLLQTGLRLDLLLEQLAQQRAACAAGAQRRQALREQWRAAQVQSEQMRAAARLAQQRDTTAEAACAQAEAQLARYPQAALDTQRSQCAARRSALQDLQRLQAGHATQEALLAQLDEQSQALQQQTTALAATLLDLERTLPTLELLAEQAATQHQRALDVADQHTVQLRQRLRPGEPCAVCGSLAHPFATQPPAADAALLAVLDELARQARQAGLDHSAARDRWLEAQTHLQLVQSQQLQVHEQHRTLSATVAAEWQSLQMRAGPVLGLAVAHGGELHQQCELALAAVETEWRTLQADWQAALQAQDALRAAQQQRLQTQQACAEAERAAATAEQKALDIAEDGRRLSAELERLQAIAAEHAVQVQQIEGWPAELEPHDASLDLDAIRVQLRQRARAFAEHQQQAQRAEQELQALALSLAAGQHGLEHTLRPSQQQALTRAQSASAAVTTAAQARAVLSAERDTERWERRLRLALEHSQAAASACAHQARQDAAALEHARLQCAHSAARLEAAEQQARRASSTLTAALRAHASPDAAPDRAELRRCLAVDATQRAAWARSIADAESARATARQQRMLSAQQLAQLRAQAPVFDTELPRDEATARWRTRLAEAQAAHRSALEQQGRARAQLEADAAALERHARVQAELESARQEQRTWAQLDELIGSADGSRFRRLAQQYTLDIVLAHANVHLSGLAARYQLRREGESLLVVDADLGDVQRAVHSLSGGESFLVSLALALGLASMSAQRLRIESLFIDEGFGALDNDSLRLALDVLDRLQAQGRKVGLISHLPELTERIATRIDVRRVGHGASVVEVRG